MRVQNIINSNGNRVANQFVISNSRGVLFQSYNSPICQITKKGNVYLTEDWDYSNTTRKHLYIFLRDNGYEIESRKDVLRNIKTGAFRMKSMSDMAKAV